MNRLRPLLKLIFCLPVCLLSCSSANNKPLSVGFSSDTGAIIFTPVDPAGLFQLSNTPGIDTAFSGILAVMEEQRGMETEQPGRQLKGKLRISGDSVLFLPSAPFVRGRSYQVTSFLNTRFASPEMVLKGKLNHTLKPQQFLLTR